MINLSLIVSFLTSTLRLALPLGFASMGEGFLERAGSVNLGLEGLMLFGAWGGVVGSHFSGSPWIGLGFGILVGISIAALEAFIVIYLHANEVVVGVAINTLSLGITSFGYRVIFGISGPAVIVPTFHALSIPLLSKIPILGPVLFNQPLLVYILVVIAIALLLILKKTSWGLDIRSSGEDPWVTEAEGANVYRIRFLAFLLSGILAACGGAFISLYNVSQFFDGMTSGRGFIALAIVVIGRWNPLGILAAAVFFGASEALGLALQAHLGDEKGPFQLLLIIPFLITMIILPFASSGKSAPAALGNGYTRGKGA
jgi:simple sugar transport system permease protein